MLPERRPLPKWRPRRHTRPRWSLCGSYRLRRQRSRASEHARGRRSRWPRIRGASAGREWRSVDSGRGGGPGACWRRRRRRGFHQALLTDLRSLRRRKRAGGLQRLPRFLDAQSQCGRHETPLRHRRWFCRWRRQRRCFFDVRHVLSYRHRSRSSRFWGSFLDDFHRFGSEYRRRIRFWNHVKGWRLRLRLGFERGFLRNRRGQRLDDLHEARGAQCRDGRLGRLDLFGRCRLLLTTLCRHRRVREHVAARQRHISLTCEPLDERARDDLFE